MLMQKEYRAYFRPSDYNGQPSKMHENIRHLNIHEHDELTDYLDMNIQSSKQSSAGVSQYNEKINESLIKLS